VNLHTAPKNNSH